MQEIIGQLLLILRGAWRYRWYALALTWFLSLLGWIIVATIPDQFESRAQVYVDTESLLKPLLEGIAVNRDIMSQVAMMQAVMLSRPNLERVARDSDLFLEASSPRERERVVDELERQVRLESAAGARRTRRDPGGGTFSVSYENSNPATAYRVVQSLLNTFIEDSLGMKRDDAGVAQRFLLQQLRDYEQKLIQAESRLAEFKKNNVGLLPGAQGDYYQRLDSAMGELEELRGMYRQVSERRNELQRQLLGEEPTFGLSGSVSGDPIDSQIASYQARIDQLLVQYTEKHPEVVALKETIARLREERQGGATMSSSVAPPMTGTPTEEMLTRSLDLNPVYQSMKIALSQADAELAEMRGQLNMKEQAVANLRSRVDAIPEVEAELTRLNRDYNINKKQYDDMLQRLESARISEQADQSQEDVKFRVIEPPVEPITPSGPPRDALSALVLLLSIAAGLGLALFLQQARPVFSTRDSVQRVTGLTVVGAVTAATVAGVVPWYKRQTALVGVALGALLVVFLLNLILQDNLRATLRNLMG